MFCLVCSDTCMYFKISFQGYMAPPKQFGKGKDCVGCIKAMAFRWFEFFFTLPFSLPPSRSTNRLVLFSLAFLPVTFSSRGICLISVINVLIWFLLSSKFKVKLKVSCPAMYPSVSKNIKVGLISVVTKPTIFKLPMMISTIELYPWVPVLVTFVKVIIQVIK